MSHPVNMIVLFISKAPPNATEKNILSYHLSVCLLTGYLRLKFCLTADSIMPPPTLPGFYSLCAWQTTQERVYASTPPVLSYWNSLFVYKMCLNALCRTLSQPTTSRKASEFWLTDFLKRVTGGNKLWTQQWLITTLVSKFIPYSPSSY